RGDVEGELVELGDRAGALDGVHAGVEGVVVDEVVGVAVGEAGTGLLTRSLKLLCRGIHAPLVARPRAAARSGRLCGVWVRAAIAAAWLGGCASGGTSVLAQTAPVD